jgi:hypothetical protein
MASNNTAASVIDFIELTGALFQKHAALLDQTEKSAKDCSALIPKAVEALCANDCIAPHQKDAAAAELTDPAKVLQILINTANFQKAAAAKKLGEPHRDKKAAVAREYNSLTDMVVGRVHRPGKRESDKVWEQGLGLNFSS